MRAVRLIFRAEFRRRWRSWLALAVLVAIVGGVVLAAVAAGNRTAAAYPRFVAAHGYDGLVYDNDPLPQLARLPDVTSVVEAPIAFNGTPRCACTHPVNATDLAVYDLSPAGLARTVNLVAGRMPNQSDPHEVLASFNLEQDNGIHVGSVLHVPFYAASQAQALFDAGGDLAPRGPTVTLHVVGIEAAELEFPSGTTPSYGLYTTAAFARHVLPETATGFDYFVTLRHGTADAQRFKAEVAKLGPAVQLLEAFETPAVLVAGAIHPQAVGWWVLALLAAVAGLAVIGQALSRQRAVEAEEYPTLQSLGMGPRALVELGMAGTAIIGVAGALGAMTVAYALSPLAPVGEARYAESAAGFSFDALTLVLGGLATFAVVIVLGLWPAVRATRRSRQDRRTRPSTVAGFVAGAGAPPAAVIGVRHALERGRGPTGVPVSTALLGTVLAVAALCATAIFSTSLTNLTHSPRLYGDDYQALVYAQNPGPDPLVARLEHNPSIAAITVGTGAPFTARGVHFVAFATSTVRGPTLLSAVTGRLPSAADEIALGATTMRAIGAHVGSVISVTPQAGGGGGAVSPSAGGAPRNDVRRFRVVGTVALPTGVAADQAGMGSGAAITLSGYFSAICPTRHDRSTCLEAAHRNVQVAVFVRAVPGPRGASEVSRLVRADPLYASVPAPPTGLVNFGEAVNFPLIFGLLLALFGVATLIHLLVVSVARRRREMGLLKALGFVNTQVAAAVYWQATTVGVIGLVVGVPVGVIVGRATWHAFALNIGVVPLSVVDISMIVAIAACVLAVGAIVAVVPAVVAGRTRPSLLLHEQ